MNKPSDWVIIDADIYPSEFLLVFAPDVTTPEVLFSEA
jgi:hypothetical protein